MNDLHSTDVRGVIFDLDGTLYPLGGTLKLRVLASMWRDINLLRHVSGSRQSVRGREFDNAAMLDGAVYTELARRSGVTMHDAARWYTTQFLPGFVRVLARSRTGRPGIGPLLARMRARGFKLAVLSDYSAVDERLAALGIGADAFDVRATSSESGALKPSPLPFSMVAQRLGLAPHHMVAVGDRDDMDLEGSRAAGMAYVGIKGSRSSAQLDWSQVLQVLDQLRAQG